MSPIKYKLILNYCVLVAGALAVESKVLGQQNPTTPLQSSQIQQATPAQLQPTPKEQKVKAAYIYNFSRYFEWPEQSFQNDVAPFVIGVLGPDPLGTQLDRLALKKTVRNRKIVVQRFESMDRYQSCQMLFVTRTVSEEEFRLAVEKAASEHVLVVSEKPPETRQGSSVQIFIDEAGKVGFEIDVGVVNARNLQVSAKLLKLASVSNSVSK